MNIWSLYQITQPRNPSTIYNINKTLELNTNYVYLVYSIFQSVKQTSIYLIGNFPCILESSSFFDCSDIEQNGCFNINVTDTSSVLLFKDCFVRCSSLRRGIGHILTADMITTIGQCSVTEMKNMGQQDTIGLGQGAFQVDSFNSTGNEIANCPLISTGRGLVCNCRMMISKNNNYSSGGCYFGNENSEIFKCLFVNCKNKDDLYGLIYIHNASVIAIQCDFIDNTDNLYTLELSSTLVFDMCFCSGNQILATIGVEIFREAGKENVKNIWRMTAEGCHLHMPNTFESRQRHLIQIIAFALGDEELFA